MKEKVFFINLIETAEHNEDPDGSVAACLIKGGRIIAISPSAKDGVRHAEDLVLEMAKDQGIEIDDTITLLTTLEPCSYRSPRNGVSDCATIIIESGIKNVIYAATDPNFSTETAYRFREAGITYCQIDDDGLIQRAISAFNSTITKPTTILGIERKLPDVKR